MALRHLQLAGGVDHFRRASLVTALAGRYSANAWSSALGGGRHQFIGVLIIVQPEPGASQRRFSVAAAFCYAATD
jgi:hypothetical protein